MYGHRPDYVENNILDFEFFDDSIAIALCKCCGSTIVFDQYNHWVKW